LFDFTINSENLVLFDASQSFDPENDALIYQWDYGDGSPTETGMQTVHHYGRMETTLLH
jgi:hypothetical protein